MSTELFADFDPAHPVWGRDNRSGHWHLLGPTLPRIAPVSPRIITPCGAEALYADSTKTSANPDIKQRCRACQRFLEHRAQFGA